MYQSGRVQIAIFLFYLKALGESQPVFRLVYNSPSSRPFTIIWSLSFMELIVFDLDGTLLDSNGEISQFTRDTLAALSHRGIAYTVATGRTLHASRDLLSGHGFSLPDVFKNGLMIWDPATEEILHQNYLAVDEVEHVLTAIMHEGLAAFIFTLDGQKKHAVYHTPLQSEIERKLSVHFSGREQLEVHPAAQLPPYVEITNISALGVPESVERVRRFIDDEPFLVAYSGQAWDGDEWQWIDIHHCDASKGGAVDILRTQLEVSRVICFGDSDNDLSMFEQADESYAPDNAAEHIRNAATAVIGHHDEDGIAHFLRERFDIRS